MSDDSWLAAIFCCSQKSNDYQAERPAAPVQRNRPKIVPRELGDGASVAGAGAAKSAPWRVTFAEGIVLRRAPNDFHAKTHIVLSRNECFHISEVVAGDAGVLFLRLADGRGWAFDRKPDVGVVAQRVHRGTVCSPGDLSQHPAQHVRQEVRALLSAGRGSCSAGGFETAAQQSSPTSSDSACSVCSTGPMTREAGVNTVDASVAMPQLSPTSRTSAHPTSSADDLTASVLPCSQAPATSPDASHSGRCPTEAAQSSSPRLPRSAHARSTLVYSTLDDIRATPLSSSTLSRSRSAHVRSTLVYSTLDEIRATPLSSPTLPRSVHATRSPDSFAASKSPSAPMLLSSAHAARPTNAYTSAVITATPLSPHTLPTTARAKCLAADSSESAAECLADNLTASEPLPSPGLVVYRSVDEIRPTALSSRASPTSARATCSADNSTAATPPSSPAAVVDSSFDETRATPSSEPRSPKQMSEVSLVVGDLVRVAPGVTSPRYGWVAVKQGDVGRVSSVCSQDVLSIDFDSCKDWLGHPADLELVVRELDP